MRRVVAAAVGLLVMLGARPSWGEGVEPVRLPDGSALPAVEFDRHVASLFVAYQGPSTFPWYRRVGGPIQSPICHF